MSFTKFCPKCGKDTEVLIKGRCKDCYLKGEDLFSVKDISIDFCSRCEKIRPGFKWTQKSDEEIMSGVESKVKVISDLEQPKIFVEMNKKDETSYNIKIKVVGLLADVLVEQEKEFVLDLEKTICDPCMRLSSDYSEAIIQLRSNDIEEMLKLTEQFIEDEKVNDSLSGIIKIVKVKTGFDVWLGSRKAGNKVATKLSRLYSTKPIISKKLIGLDNNGKRQYRITFCIKC